jgi:hypothetical protein
MTLPAQLRQTSVLLTPSKPSIFLLALFLLLPLTLIFPHPTAAQQSYPPGIYGTPWNAENVGNIPIGECQKCRSKVSFRFRAPKSGTVDKVRYCNKHGSGGYHGGDGGDILIELQTDDNSTNHHPSGVALASTTLEFPLEEQPYPLLNFNQSAQLTEGQLYHLVFSNTDPIDPITNIFNFVSLNGLWMQSPTTPLHPAVSDTDLIILTQLPIPGSDWIINNKHTPIYEIHYSDGTVHGQGYIHGWSWQPKPISGPNKVRQFFTVDHYDRSVMRLSFRITKSGNPGNLTIRLEHSDGSLIEQGTISASQISTNYSWVDFTFVNGPHLLQTHQTYHLEFSAPPGDAYHTFPLQDGSIYWLSRDFPTSNLFTDGYAQFTSGATWLGWDTWGKSDRRDGDLQFYFTLSDQVPVPTSTVQPSFPQLLSTWLTSTFDQNGDNKVNSLDFASLIL